MDGHNSLNFYFPVTTLSLRYYSINLASVFTAEHVLTRKDMLSNAL
jgi:hypothetical protein